MAVTPMADRPVVDIDVTPLAVALCHPLHLMNDSPLPCRACITKVAKAGPVLADLFGKVQADMAERIALAIEDLNREDFKYDEFDVGTFAAADVARSMRP
jgi:hypothetical protein